MIWIALLCLAAGLALASFLGVIAYRVPRGEGFVAGRSHCDHCEQPVAARDNVPVLSWMALGGRSRCCGEPIPVRYPLIELALGAAFAANYLVLEDQPAAELALGFVFLALLAAITLTDLERRIIPNKFLVAGAIAGLAIIAPALTDSLSERLAAAGVGGGILFLIAYMYPRGMGMGDVKLVAVMGLFLGKALAPAVLVGLLAGALVGGAMIARGGAAARKQAVPFGPFLALGGVVGLLAGEPIVDWYVDEFFPSE